MAFLLKFLGPGRLEHNCFFRIMQKIASFVSCKKLISSLFFVDIQIV